MLTLLLLLLLVAANALAHSTARVPVLPAASFVLH